MPVRVTLSRKPSLQDSVTAAHEALETGRTVSVGSQGNLEVTDITETRGGTFAGRDVRYLKNSFSPYRERRRNHEIIAALNEQISREFGPDHRLNIRTVLSSADTNERFLQSIIDSVSNLRAGSEYTRAESPEEAARNTLKFGFAGEVTAASVIPCRARQESQVSDEEKALPFGVTETAREQLFWYNRAMNDIFTRFPKLRNLPAITTLRLDMPNDRDTYVAHYHIEDASICLASIDMERAQHRAYKDTGTGFLTPKLNYGGYIHHEYAHNLSRKIVPEQVWVPKLVEALKAGGMPHARITYTGGKPGFDRETAGKLANSVSEYAAKNALECAAEILSWYMNPEYGKSESAMPDYLEHWVTECFPMLNND